MLRDPVLIVGATGVSRDVLSLLQVAHRTGILHILDNVDFYDFEMTTDALKTRRKRWTFNQCAPSCGVFI